MKEWQLTIIFGYIYTLSQIWVTFKASDKNYEAKKTLILGIAILILFLIFSGWLPLERPQKLFQSLIQEFSNTVDLKTLIIWALMIILVPETVRFYFKKFSPKKIIKTSKNKKGRKSIKRNNSKGNNSFQDSLTNDLSKWKVITGQPQISNIRGFNTASSLLLEEYPLDRRHSFIIANTKEIKNGKIECDVYLERDALVNIVFRADSGPGRFYMARVDSRSAGSCGILYCENYTSWNYIQTPNVIAPSDHWYHIEVTFKDNNLSLKIDNSTVVSLNDQRLAIPGYVGIFNEVKRAFVNNFVVTELN